MDIAQNAINAHDEACRRLHELVDSAIANGDWLVITPGIYTLRAETLTDFCFLMCMIVSEGAEKQCFDEMRNLTAHMSRDQMLSISAVTDIGQRAGETPSGMGVH